MFILLKWFRFVGLSSHEPWAFRRRLDVTAREASGSPPLEGPGDRFAPVLVNDHRVESFFDCRQYF